MSSPRIALVGSAESVSPWLLRSISTHTIFEAICDPQAEASARQYQARWAFSDLAAMLRDGPPDGVVLARPIAERSRLIKQCLAAGVGVLVSGSPGPAAACKRLSSFAKLSGRVILAAPAVRFSPSMQLARRLLESGRAGVPVLATLRSTRRGLARGSTDEPGRLPSDQVFEAVDLIYHLLGPLQQVFAATHEDDALVATAVSVNGVPVSIVLHANGPSDAVGIDLEIRAADGTRLRLDTDGRLLCGSGSRMHSAHHPTLANADPAVELGYTGLITEFVRYLRSGRASTGLVGPVAPVAAAAEALLTSAARGRPVAPKAHPDRRPRLDREPEVETTDAV